MRLLPATRNFTPVSSPWITRDSSNRVCIKSYSGVSNSDAPEQPVAQRRGRDRHTRAGQLAGESMHGDVVGELGGDDVGQQTRTAQPLGDRPDLRRAGGLDALLRRHGRRVAVPAGVALLDGAEDEELGRFQVELLGRLLADARPRPTAARAELLGLGQVVDDLATFEVFGQRRAAVLITPARRLLGGRHGGGVRRSLRRPNRCFRAASSLAVSSAFSARSCWSSASSSRTIAWSVGTSVGSGASGASVVASMPVEHRSGRRVARSRRSGRRIAFEPSDAGHVDAVEDHGELGGGQFDPGGGGLGEVVPPGFQSLAPQAQAVTAPVQHLDAVRRSDW